MSNVLLGSLLFFFLILFDGTETLTCPTGYNYITMGCYKIINGTNEAWSTARNICANETLVLSVNETTPGAKTHLLALEVLPEKNALFYWMSAYGLQSPFWIDGNVSSSIWDWSQQSITWYFEPEKRAIIGNGTNYKLIYNYNQSSFQIADDVQKNKLYFICEYQAPCNTSGSCQNNGTCYMNIGQELCVCASGYTGDSCETELDECLSSPCQHGGRCTDHVNNYSCDCSDIFYTGRNCEAPKVYDGQSERTKAFWAVVGIVTSIVVILTLSDLPWEDIMVGIGCAGHRMNFCQKKRIKNNTNEIDLNSCDDDNEGRKSSMNEEFRGPKGTNYNVMNAVWNAEYADQTPRNPQYNGYRSPDQGKTPSNAHIQSYAANYTAGEKQKQMEDKRIYAVDINNSTSKTTDPADTMVSWTQQLQEQLRNKKPREASATSTKQLIHSSNDN